MPAGVLMTTAQHHGCVAQIRPSNRPHPQGRQAGDLPVPYSEQVRIGHTLGPRQMLGLTVPPTPALDRHEVIE